MFFLFPIFYLRCVVSPTLRLHLVSSALCSWFPSMSFYLLCYHWALIYKHTFQMWRIFWSYFISPLVSCGPSVIQMFNHLNLSSHFLYVFFFSFSCFSPVCLLALLSGSFPHLFLPTLLLSFQFLLSYFYCPGELLSECSLFAVTGLVL